jgi:CheY-like chemotaxis protein
MSAFAIDGRVRLSMALALVNGSRDPPVPPEREAEARGLGMCGAEIDAARLGRSFDARTSRALALAAAACNGDRLPEERVRAVRSGIPAEVCREIESLVEDLAGSASDTELAVAPPPQAKRHRPGARFTIPRRSHGAPARTAVFVTVVEDEYLIAMGVKRWLQAAGSEVLGPVPSVDQALDLIEECRPDAAVLDVNMSYGEDVYPVADKLSVLGVPYLFATGDVRLTDTSVYRHRPRLEKPLLEAELVRAVATLVATSQHTP